MERFAILEGNMERLEKKLITIQNKCEKYGCSFSYNKVGEEFRTLEDEKGNKYQARFILVEAEGKDVEETLGQWYRCFDKEYVPVIKKTKSGEKEIDIIDHF